MAGYNSHQVTFEDVWQLWEDIEHAEGAVLVVALHRPRALQNGGTYHARLSVTATRREGKTEKARTEYCQVGGARGARTVPAAFVRAASALAARLEEARKDVAEQSAF